MCRVSIILIQYSNSQLSSEMIKKHFGCFEPKQAIEMFQYWRLAISADSAPPEHFTFQNLKFKRFARIGMPDLGCLGKQTNQLMRGN